MPQFSEKEITDTVSYELDSCTKCGSTKLEKIGITYRDEYDYEVKVIIGKLLGN